MEEEYKTAQMSHSDTQYSISDKHEKFEVTSPMDQNTTIAVNIFSDYVQNLIVTLFDNVINVISTIFEQFEKDVQDPPSLCHTYVHPSRKDALEHYTSRFSTYKSQSGNISVNFVVPTCSLCISHHHLDNYFLFLSLRKLVIQLKYFFPDAPSTSVQTDGSQHSDIVHG